MFRRAEWKPRREDARGFWTLFVLHPPVLAAVLGFGALLAIEGLDLLPLVGFIGGLGVLAPRRPRRSRSHGRALAEIAPWPPPPGVFPARILYYQGIDPVGDDEAVVAFGDGWITVEGLRAFFSLRPTDASVLYVEANGCDLLLPGGERVEIRPYDAFEVGGESQGSLRNRFELALSRWAEGDAGREDAFAIFPPMRGRLGSSARRTALIGATGAVLTWASWLRLMDAPGASYLAYETLFGIGLAALVCAAVRLRLHARARRRLPPGLR